MEAVTISKAKARLNALVEAAERGEQVLLMRGSKLVAAIVPVSARDFDLAPRLSDAQAERLWRQIRDERGDGSSLLFDSPRETVAFLSGHASSGRRAPAKRGRRAKLARQR
jgi:prevent-host-death family protein